MAIGSGKHRRSSESRGRGRTIALIATPLAVIVSGALVWNSTYAAFNAQVTNGANNWQAGTVRLAGSDGSTSSPVVVGTALFNTTNDGNLKPGSTASRCVTVTYSGTLAALPVKFYISGGTTGSAALASALTITVNEGTLASDAACTGFVAGTNIATGTLSALAAANTSYATGAAGSWTPTASPPTTNRSYRITYTLDPAAANSLQGTATAATFAWETQNS